MKGRTSHWATVAGVAAALLLLTACATVPEDLQPVPEIQPTLTEVRDHPDAHVGAPVVWGGTVAAVSNFADGTRIEVVSRPLGRDQRPLEVDRSPGRFHAFFPDFLDPQVHAPMREITVRGRVAGVSEGLIGAFPYVFPKVDADSVHLWPVREPVPTVIYRDPFWDPWWPHWRNPWRRW